MKKLLLLFSLLLTVSILLAQQVDLETFLKSQPEIKSVEKIESNKFFTATYKIMVEQALDASHPENGSFLQRVFVADKDIKSPVLVVTEGYTADYAENPNYINELSPMLGSNQVFIEHRYFGESWPDPINWDYLTVRNAAADHHKVIEVMKRYYKGKWISTGISKGGQTAVIHRWLYPADVDFSVPYVCPLNFAVEDGRHEPFIAKKTGTPEMRDKVKNFQLYVLKNREVFLPKLEEYCKEKKYTFRIGMNEVLDYMVLEYSFSFWQWGNSADKIPTMNQNPDEIFKYLISVSDPSYFAIEEMEATRAFYVQAAREEGYYGYSTKGLKKYLSVKSTKNYLQKIFLPADLHFSFDVKPAKEIRRFIQHTDARILFIYGAWDPWYASSFEVPDKPNFLKIVKPEGSHRTRISNLPAEQKKQVKEKLEEWLGEPVNLEL